MLDQLQSEPPSFGDLEKAYAEASAVTNGQDLIYVPWSLAKTLLPAQQVEAIENFKRDNPGKNWRLDRSTGVVTEAPEDQEGFAII